jgi:phosphoribosylamine---glycine ligase
MKVLVIGGGGREHALAWRLKQSEGVSEVFVAPGNAGTARDAQLTNLPITDKVALREWVQANGVGLTVVGPEAPLAAGVVDEFRAHGLAIFGPTQKAAQLESSKAFSKAFMQRHGIPTAEYQAFTDPAQAHAYVNAKGAPIVVKADGLAAGKGVVVAMTAAEAHEAIDFMLLDNKLGVAHNEGGARVVIEEFLQGEEASFIVLCDGEHALALATSQDHKRLKDADQGPNTGGMGAYSPAPVVTPAVHQRAMDEVILPTLRGMKADGIPYTGFLYAGLMITPDGAVKTLEFNCRMGDPETQPIMMRLRSNFAQVLLAATRGRGRLPVRSAQGRRHHRPAGRRGRSHGVPRGHGGGRRGRARLGWARAVRHRAGRLGGAGAAPRLRGGGPDRLRRHAVPPRHRLSRAVIVAPDAMAPEGC